MARNTPLTPATPANPPANPPAKQPPIQPAIQPAIQPGPSVQSTATQDTGSSSSPVAVGTSQQSANSEGVEEEERSFGHYAFVMCLLLLFLYGLFYLLASVGIFTLELGDEDTTESGPLFVYRTPASGYSPRPSRTKPPKPTQPTYTRVELRGLICHSSYEKVISNPVSKLCNFLMVDIETEEPYAESGDEGATVPLVPSEVTPLFAHVWQAVHSVIFSHEGSLLRQTTRASLAQILRGLRVNIVDQNAHGLALSWSTLHESDLTLLLSQAKSLSDEMEEYHGVLRYDKYTGSPKALANFMIAVGRLPSVTLVYQVSGRSTIFTNPYYDNFYLERMNVKPLETLIDEEVVQPIIKAGGDVKVIISMSLVARSCPVGTVYENKRDAHCASAPLDMAEICQLWPANVQGHYYSFMTRRSSDGKSSLTEDIFFETQYTVARKAYLMLKQLKGAKVSPLAFVIQRYDLDITEAVTSECAAGLLGVINMTKSEIEKVI